MKRSQTKKYRRQKNIQDQRIRSRWRITTKTFTRFRQESRKPRESRNIKGHGQKTNGFRWGDRRPPSISTLKTRIWLTIPGSGWLEARFAPRTHHVNFGAKQRDRHPRNDEERLVDHQKWFLHSTLLHP